MPSNPTVKLLFEEENAAGDDLGNWNRKTQQNGSGGIKREKRKFRWGLCWCLSLSGVMLLAGIAIGLFAFSQLYADCIEEKQDENDDSKITLEEEIFAECGQGYPWKQVRLPTDILPTNYRLKIHPNLDNLEIVGTVDMELHVQNETRIIVFHAQDMNLTSFTIRLGSQRVHARHLICPRLLQWAFETDEAFPVNSVIRLSMDYTGFIHKDLSGLYINTHQDKMNGTNETSISAVTQFEPTHARKMLPCFDEPNFKAVFDISIIRKKEHLARTNMQLIRSEDYEDDLMIDQFSPSVKMSTYLLAIAVLDNFSKVRKMTKRTDKPVEINLFAPSDSIKGQTEYGLDTAVRALEYFEDYFNIPFSLQKTDLIALDDFAEGAMENWGIITFRDAMLLYHPQRSTEKTRETIALVICHEFAHQWFGNLVTMEWWQDLWLNEGFANFMEYLCVDNLFPEWNVVHDFFIENFLQSMLQDGFRSSHAVSTEVSDPAQIGSIFDAISYQKGASIIQMLRGLSGKDAFRTALQKYLKKFEFSNAKGEDLWRIIQNHVTLSTSISVMDVAEAWTTQIGYPIIQVELIDEGTTMLIKDQVRFLFLEEERYDNHTEQWPIPVQYQTNKQSQLKLTWLEPDAKDVKVSIGPKADWIIANSDSLGYYRVLYSKDLYKEFTRQLDTNHTEIGTVDRGAILNDAFNFMRSGHLSADIVMDLIQYVEDGKESDRIPWVVIITHLKSIESLLGDSEVLDMFQRYERSLMLKIYEKVGWSQPESHVNRLLQTDLIAHSCRLQLSDCSKQAQHRFHQWLKDKNSVFVDIQPFVIEEGIRHGTATDWERVYREYLSTTNPAQRFLLLIALAATEDVTLINRFMSMCLDPSIIRPNVLPRALGVLMQNKIASQHAWRFFRMNYEQIEQLYGGATTLLGTLIKAIIENFNTEFDFKQVQEFFDGKDLGASRSRVDQAIEMIKLNIQWRKLNERPMQQWLKKWAIKRNFDS
uniref:Aminopeptidase n=1 Tax=Panagrolaimus sp. PS1159 TaxID=55785 RepID=A0AC35EUK0_9BILA